MTIKITKEQYGKLVRLMVMAEIDSLEGNRAQVYFDTANGRAWLGHLDRNEHYPDDENFVVIYAVEPWKDKLKDTYEDNNADVDWDDENYRFTSEYYAFYDWYFGNNVDGFKVYEILNESLERHGIEVEGE